MGATPIGIALRPPLVFISSWPWQLGEGLYVLNAVDAAEMEQKGFLETPAFVSDVAVSADILFAADSTAGVNAFSIAGCGVGHLRPLGPP